MVYRPLPAIDETADALKAAMKAERHPDKHQRLHALYLLASGQARTRTQVADQLGVSRETVGHWLATYTAGGLQALLTLYVPRGKQSRVTPAARADLERVLRDPDGCPSYEAMRDWLWQTHGIWYETRVLANLCRTIWGPRAKVVRPRPKKHT